MRAFFRAKSLKINGRCYGSIVKEIIVECATPADEPVTVMVLVTGRPPLALPLLPPPCPLGFPSLPG